MGVQNVPESRGDEKFSGKSKRKRPTAVRDFPFGCGPQFIKRPTETSSIDSRNSEDPLIMTHPKSYFPQKFKRVSKDVAMVVDVPTKQCDDINAWLNGDGWSGDSGFVYRDIVPRVRNSSAAANTSKLAKTATLNGPRDVKPIRSFRDGGEEMVSGKTSAVRHKVEAVLQLYHDVLARLKKENTRKSLWENKECVYMSAAKHLKLQGKWLNSSKILGAVPGVEIGDKFLYRAEMNVIGLHCQPFNGIDYMRYEGINVATSIVASGRYRNYELDDTLIYSGSGGNPTVRGRQQLHDQKLKGGNLALKNCMDRKTPVRVIRKESFGLKRFYYDGLYSVEKFWHERGESGKIVFKFMLRRIRQPMPNMVVSNMVEWKSSEDQALFKLNSTETSRYPEGGFI